jgi:hypothetical protein
MNIEQLKTENKKLRGENDELRDWKDSAMKMLSRWHKVQEYISKHHMIEFLGKDAATSTLKLLKRLK